ncbi:MAG: glycoside hydrolase N-terminal domain-containing protein [Planctomycetaceae bacterium]|nr:glycoside hydrolase N-terminal domain-containing protein [Planctomycetaceae bacterium]
MKAVGVYCAGLFSAMLFLAAGYAAGDAPPEVNFESLVSRADLFYEKPAYKGEEGLPIGNGRMGSLVWTSPAALKLQINRVDVFANNAAANSFPERHSDYCGGCAFVDIDFVRFGADVFAEGASQSLSCYDGLVNVNGSGVTAQVLAWREQDVFAVRITDQRAKPDGIAISLRMLRAPVVKTRSHTAASELIAQDDRILLTQKFTEDDYYCGSAVAVAIAGRNTLVRRSNDQELQLIAEPAQGSFTIFISSSASFDRDQDLAVQALTQLDAARGRGYAGLLQSNKKWWHDFWAKSFIHLHSADGTADFIEQNYTYYLYIMASSSRGRFPAKFNGMLWTTDGDRRAWGGQYWGANQSCLYNALMPTGRWELMDPMFDMYTAMFDACALAARQQWGSEGIFVPETCTFDGFASLPDDIAAEMRDLYLVKKPWSQLLQRFRDYAATKQPHSSRWNWIGGGKWQDGKWLPVERPESPFGPVTHIFSRGAKIAYMYWQRYEYTMDELWLRDRAYPMLKGVAEFYRHFPNLKKQADGKYYIDHVNSNESVRDARHTDEEVSAMRGILPAAIRAAEILNVDPQLRTAWTELLNNLASLPVSGEDTQQPRWMRALSAASGNPSGRPDGNTMPQWFFDLCTLENTDVSTRRIAETTFEGYLRGGVNPEQHIGVLSKVAVTAAMMGRADAIRYLLPNQLRYPDRAPVLPNRMDQREGEQTTSVQRLGRAADALHNALLQSVGSGPAQPPVIRVFGAWPKEWDAAFTLMARGGFEVSSSMKDGRIELIQIHSGCGGPCRVRNPWTVPVQLWHSGQQVRRLEGSLLQFETLEKQTLVLTPQGTSPEQFKRSVPIESIQSKGT